MTNPPEKRTNEEIADSCVGIWRNGQLEKIVAALSAKDREREEAVREQIVKDINLAKNADDYGDEGMTRHVIVESLRDQLTPTQE